MRTVLIASLISLALGLIISTGAHVLARDLFAPDRTKETLRLLRRGDKRSDICRPDVAVRFN